MKKLFNILLLGIALFLGLTVVKSCDSGGVSESQFYRETDSIENELIRVKENQRIMQMKIDSIMQGMDVLKGNQEVIIYRLDTLQAGQILIYSEITGKPKTQETKRNFFDNAIDFVRRL